MAEHSYEINEVNEMLQCMGRFTGLSICITNLFDALDEVALRRFTFKIRFKGLTAGQRERVFAVEALDGRADVITDEQRQRLRLRLRLRLLDLSAPGDFAAVKQQTEVLDELFEPDEFLSQLEAEPRVKPEVRQQRAMGFVKP